MEEELSPATASKADTPSDASTRSKRKRQPYEAKSFNLAILGIKQGKLSIYRAAAKYNIPKSTLRSRMKSDLASGGGPPTFLSQSEEDRLSDWLNYRHDMESTVGWSELLATVEKMLLDKGHPGSSEDSAQKISTGWLLGFKRRHPNVPILRTKKQGWYSPRFTFDVMNCWMKTLHDRIKSYTTTTVKNLLETESQSVFSIGSILFSEKDGILLSDISETTSKGQTVCQLLVCYNNTGDYIKPHLMVVQNQCVNLVDCNTCLDCFNLKQVENYDDSFNIWFPYFVKRISELSVPTPVVLLLTALVRVNMTSMKLALDNEILLFCFPLHSQKYQPPEMNLISSIKNCVGQLTVIDSQNFLSKFLPHLGNVYTEHASAAAASSSFAQCGIIPLGKEYSLVSKPMEVSPDENDLESSIYNYSDVIKGMELSLKIIEERCMEKQYLPLYREFYLQGKLPSNDPMYLVWKELTMEIERAKCSFSEIEQSIENNSDNSKSNVSPNVESPENNSIPQQQTVQNQNLDSNEMPNIPPRDTFPISDRYRREFNFDAMPALNLEQHALEILEKYHASLGDSKLEQLVIDADADFGGDS